ncbi:lipid-binding SYLF domain-containing protein [Vibrio amylolyticus]|uniref:lipid-binding SYLF domain-containing protein n=1 Tax=Vibrio amylolyticus TaxID=2847292 RepID=UPI00354DF2CF
MNSLSYIPQHKRQAVYYALSALIAIIFTVFSHQANASDTQLNKAEQLVDHVELNVDEFLTKEHWEAVRGLSGVARAVVIIPKGYQAGFLLGAQWGKGVMFLRTDHRWSAPVFVKMSSVQFGLLAGIQSFNGIGAVLSQDALTKVFEGRIGVGGSADTTIGLGVSGKAIGGTKGIQQLMVSANKGLYIGGSLEGSQLKLDDKLNVMAYGEDFNMAEFLEGGSGAASELGSIVRKQLEDEAYNAVYGSNVTP